MNVVISGIGYIGPGAASWRQAVANGAPALAPWPEQTQAPSPASRIGRVADFPRARFLSDREAAKVDRLAAMATTAAGLALEDAGLVLPLPADSAAFFATCRGEIGSGQRYAAPLFNGKPRMLNPALFPLMCRNLFCGQIAIRFGLSGPSSMMSGGTLSGLHALARSARAVRRGAVVALAGAAEAMSKFSLDVAHALYGAQLADAPSFFAPTGGGLVPSEGACMLVLEDEQSAKARGARIYARLEDATFGRAEDAMPPPKAAWNDIGLISSGQSGAAQPQDLRELALWQGLAQCPPLAAARALTGEAESMSTLAQVALAAHALAEDACPPVWRAADTSFPISRAGQKLAAPRALVSAMDGAGNYAYLTLSREDVR